MDDDFTFPTVDVAAPPAEEQQGVGELPCPEGHYLWPFSSSAKNAPPAKRATTVQDGEDAPAPGRSGRAVVEQHHGEAHAVGEDRMDMLWENFNDVEPAAGSPDGMCRSSTTASDAEFDEMSGRRYGCAPTMLRASSRAGGAGQFFTSGRGRTTAGWTLLLRLFRSLFAVDKTPPSRSRCHGIYVP